MAPMRRRRSPSFRPKGAGSSAKRRSRPAMCGASAGLCRGIEGRFVRSARVLEPEASRFVRCWGRSSLADGKREERAMKAAVLYEVNKPLVIEDVSISKPGPREVLLRTAYAGLCHSDLHFIEGLFPIPTPVVLGHESSAVVEAVGEGVAYVKTGDHVITCVSIFCGTCPQCLTGHPNLCENTEIKMLPGVA